MHPCVGNEILIKKNLWLNLQGQCDSKKKKMDFKGALREVIVPSDGTQPFVRLRKDRALPCKVVITSTHALHRHLRGFRMVKALTTLSTQW